MFDEGPTDGDCGSWVVDSQTGKVYGHIVALDTFGEAYIVPSRDSFQDIAKQLGCASVHIPTGQEICDYWTNQEPPMAPSSPTAPTDSGYSSLQQSPARSNATTFKKQEKSMTKKARKMVRKSKSLDFSKLATTL